MVSQKATAPMDPQRLWTASLRAAPCGDAITAIMAAALSAVEPGAAVRRCLRREGDTLIAGERAFDLRTIDRVLVIGAGKAGAPMARAAADVLGPALSAGLVVVKDGHFDGPAPPRVAIVEAGHPVPDERGVAAARRLTELLRDCSPRDLVIALISGGGSALLTLPAPGITLTDLQALTADLLASGASIGEINALRKHLDLVKGGGLARMAHPAALVTLVLSDVVGNPLDVIASGPTVADTSTFGEAWAVLERYGLSGRAPAGIVAHLRAGLAGAIPETPKPGDPALAGASTTLVGSNQIAADAALAAAQAAGFHTLLLTTFLEGEAREAGRFLAAVLRELAASNRPLPRPACLVVGGETTVTLRGAGRGGRNQELALAAALALAGTPDVALVALATDGGDGPTDAAGAVATGDTVRRARALGLDPAARLAHNDAYPFFEALGDLLRPGPTTTNVNDLAFLFAW